MPSNIEIKARLLDKELALCIAKELSHSEGTVLKQVDTFYNISNGRLKLIKLVDTDSSDLLRVIGGEKAAQLISYSREDVAGPKKSDFTIAYVENSKDINKVLMDSLGILGVVKKTRLLFLIGQTRVHIDTVDGLGNFIELEVLLQDEQSPSEGEEVARCLMEKLKIKSDHLITCAYMDLLLQKTSH